MYSGLLGATFADENGILTAYIDNYGTDEFTNGRNLFDGIGYEVAAVNLSLEGDVATGEASIVNNSGVPLSIDYYEIRSESGALDDSTWLSLDEQGVGAINGGSSSTQLKQLALALHNYHTTHQELPPGADGVGVNRIAHRHTWFEYLMPYVELEAIHSQIDFSVRKDDPVNQRVLNDFISPALMCPSDEDAGLFNNSRELSYLPGPAGTLSLGMLYIPSDDPLKMNFCFAPPVRVNNVVINCQSERGGAIGSTAKAYGAPGMFAGGPHRSKFKQCIDGLSNTFLLMAAQRMISRG